MPPDNLPPAEMRSPLRAGERMDESFDLVVKDAPLSRQDPINESSLIHMFQLQHQSLQAMMQEELDKRIPQTTTAAPNEKSQMVQPDLQTHERNSANLEYWQILGFLNQFMGRGHGNQNPQEVIEQLVHQTQQLQRENEALEGEVSAVRKQNQRLHTENNTARRDLSQERAKNQELSDRMASLRQMLVPPPEDQISDTEIIQRFTSLRAQIFRLVRSTWAKKLKDGVSERSLLEGQRTFFETYTGKEAKWKTLHNRLRYFVFYKLCRYILGPRLYGLAENYEKLDTQLKEVEEWLWDKTPEERRGLIMDWRLATIKVTEQFRDDQRSAARIANHYIWNFLGVLETNGSDAERKGKQMLKQICNDAVDLGMLMRKARDNIHVDSMDTAIGRPISEWETFVEEEASDAAESSRDKPQTIAYVLAGALVKYPKEDPREKKVLEKAQVVVYK